MESTNNSDLHVSSRLVQHLLLKATIVQTIIL